MERLADELSDEEIAQALDRLGRPGRGRRRRCEQYVDWGFDHLVFHAPGHDQARFLEQFSADVLPGLRELT